MKKLLITGASGFIGSAVCEKFTDFEVIGLTRNPERQSSGSSVRWIRSLDECREAFEGVINLAGRPLDRGRWNVRVKNEIVNSRVGLTEQLYSSLSEHPPKWLINASAIGYYGPHATDDVLIEQSAFVESFSHHLCSQWEQAASKFSILGTRVCCLRLGVVLAAHGGALKKMLPAFRLGLGGPLGSGDQWMSWIHLDDVVNIIRFCIETELDGPVNAVAPEAVTNRNFSQALAKALGRPCFFKMPACVVKTLFGEMAEELLLKGQRVKPEKLLNAHYQFLYPSIDSAFHSLKSF